jgi:hypothetical protein
VFAALAVTFETQKNGNIPILLDLAALPLRGLEVRHF